MKPLSKTLFVEVIYAFHNSRSDAQRLSFDKDLTGKYELPDDTLSNHYNFNVFTNMAGVAFNICFTFSSNVKRLTTSFTLCSMGNEGSHMGNDL